MNDRSHLTASIRQLGPDSMKAESASSTYQRSMLCYENESHILELHENASDIDCIFARFKHGLIEIGYQFHTATPIDAMTILFADAANQERSFDKQMTSCPCRNLVIDHDHDAGYLYTGYFIHPETERKTNVLLTWNPGLITRGNTTLEVNGSRARLNGEIGTQTYRQIENIIQYHTEVNTLVFGEVSANANDDIVQQTGRLIRSAGFRTELPSTGVAQGGAIVLFIAGASRVAAVGATLMVSNWYENSESDKGVRHGWGTIHQNRIAYFRDMLGAGTGEECYFLITELANSNPYHKLTSEEIIDYRIAELLPDTMHNN